MTDGGWLGAQRTRSDPTGDMLESLCRTCVREAGVDGACLSIVTGDGMPEPVHATDELSERVGDLQFTLGRGSLRGGGPHGQADPAPHPRRRLRPVAAVRPRGRVRRGPSPFRGARQRPLGHLRHAGAAPAGGRAARRPAARPPRSAAPRRPPGCCSPSAGQRRLPRARPRRTRPTAWSSTRPQGWSWCSWTWGWRRRCCGCGRRPTPRGARSTTSPPTSSPAAVACPWRTREPPAVGDDRRGRRPAPHPPRAALRRPGGHPRRRLRRRRPARPPRRRLRGAARRQRGRPGAARCPGQARHRRLVERGRPAARAPGGPDRDGPLRGLRPHRPSGPRRRPRRGRRRAGRSSPPRRPGSGSPRCTRCRCGCAPRPSVG